MLEYFREWESKNVRTGECMAGIHGQNQMETFTVITHFREFKGAGIRIYVHMDNGQKAREKIGRDR